MHVGVETAVTALALLLTACVQLVVPAPTPAVVSAGFTEGWRLVYELSVNIVLYYNITSKSKLVGARLFNGNVLICLKPLNATYVEVKAIFKGVVEGASSVKVCDYGLKSCREVPYQEFPGLTNVVPRNVSAAVTFVVDRRFNYAWLLLGGGRREFVGFLPYYIVPDLSYTNVSKHQLLYMGAELGVVRSSNGEPLPIHLSLGDRMVYAVALKNRLLTIFLVHHYPVSINGFVPAPGRGLGTNTTLAEGLCSALGSFYGNIIKVDDYPAGAVSVSWGKLALITAVLGGAAALAAYVAIVRRRER